METKTRPYKAVPPGDVLKDEIKARDWTQGDFAEIIGRPLQAVNEILMGKKAITPETAVLFSRALGTTPEFWLNLESAYRLDLLHEEEREPDHVTRKAKLYSKAPVKELIRRRWIKAGKTPEQLEAEVCTFLGISSLDEELAIAANFKKSDKGIIDTPSLIAWVRKAEIEAQKLSCKPFDSAKLNDALPELIRRSAEGKAMAEIPDRLRGLGIRLVFVPHLPQTRVDGAAFWLDKKSPVVALSLRMDRADNFWFTLIHELVHIRDDSRGGAAGYLDNDIMQEPQNPNEKQVNQKTRDLLIPPTQFRNFMIKNKPYFSRSVVLSFARDMGIHPAIVVGRLHYEEALPYTHLRNVMGKVRLLLAGHLSA
jgi:HTH-type transcriptional regulator/antitoxin HigA